MRRNSALHTACVCKLCLTFVAIGTPLIASGAAQAASPFPPLNKASYLVDWQSAWGPIEPDADVNPHNEIPVSYHTIKTDIRNHYTQRCTGVPGKTPGDILVYNLDLDGDQYIDYLTDWKGFNGCIDACDTANGCYLVGYISTAPTEALQVPPPPPQSCPTTAAANTTCNDDCPSTLAQCVGLWKHFKDLAWSDKVLDWQLYAPTVFASTRPRYPYFPVNNRLVLGLRFNNASDRCTLEEITINRGECIKYYQWVTDTSANAAHGGFYKDLYAPAFDADSDDRRLMWNRTPFDSTTARTGSRGEIYGAGTGIAHGAGEWWAIQIPNYKTAAESEPEFICREFVNASDKKYFVPTKTDGEFQAFRDHKPSGVAETQCRLQLTPWVGIRSCAEVAPACDQTINIYAERHCLRSTSSRAPCSECMTAGVQGVTSGTTTRRGFRIGNHEIELEGSPEPEGCTFSAACYGGPCVQPGDGGGGGPFDDFDYDEEACTVPAARVTMADGSTKPISQVKTGDYVLAFRTDHKASTLHKAKVTGVSLGGQVQHMTVNDIAFGPDSNVIRADKRAVAVKHLLPGDAILTAGGTETKVFKLATSKKNCTSVTLKIDGFDGFIGDGLRVLTPKPAVKPLPAEPAQKPREKI